MTANIVTLKQFIFVFIAVVQTP